MMHSAEYNFVGMHFFWWALWLLFVFWIFALPYDVPGQRTKKSPNLLILKKRLANGEITKEEYEEKKSILKI